MDIRYKKDFSLKKVQSHSAAVLEASDFDGTNSVTVFKLPENVIITRAILMPKDNPNTVNLTVRAGTDTVLNAKSSIASTTEVKTMHYSTGINISIQPSAAVTTGSVILVIDYMEYSLATGTQTN